jgi:hypothetical protein
VPVVFLVTTCSPSFKPLVISVSLSVCNPIVTGTRLRVTEDALVVDDEDAAPFRLRVLELFLYRSPVEEAVLEANIDSLVEDEVLNLREEDPTTIAVTAGFSST